MKLLKAILSGIIIWALIFVLWTILIFAPGLKNIESLQWIIHFIVLIPIVILGASLYYKTKDKTHGLVLGVIMLVVGLILDAIITVPLFIIPQGSSYFEFFFRPLLLIGFVEFLVINWIYWKKKIA